MFPGIVLVDELQLLEALAEILSKRSSEQIVYANLAKQIQVSPHTAKAWVDILVAGYLGFVVRPYRTNISKALRKEPKWYLRDWGGLDDSGSRAETLIPCHLLKATGAEHAFQVVLDLEYEAINCFDFRRPVVVPARTLLSQLV